MAYNRDTALAAVALGAIHERLPEAGTPRTRYTLVYGRWKGLTVDVWVKPQNPADPTAKRRSRPHRLFAECPYCPQQMSLGRLEQHLPACVLKPKS